MTDEKKSNQKKSNLKTIVASAAIGLTLVTVGDYFNVVDNTKDVLRSVRNYVVDITTTDAGEAAEEFIEQVVEEDHNNRYTKKLSNAAMTAYGVLPNSSKAKLTQKYLTNLPEDLRNGILYNSVQEMPDSIATFLVNDKIKTMDTQYKKEAFKVAAKGMMDNTGVEVKKNADEKYQTVKQFFKENYQTIKEKIKEIF